MEFTPLIYRLYNHVPHNYAQSRPIYASLFYSRYFIYLESHLPAIMENVLAIVGGRHKVKAFKVYVTYERS